MNTLENDNPSRSDQKSMNAVILYDDSWLAAAASTALENASTYLNEPIRWRISPWRLAMLEVSLGAQAAQVDAAEAHLIVLAMQPHWELPIPLLAWLEYWAEHRKIRDAALASFVSDGQDSLSSPPLSPLLEFAERHGLSFLSGTAHQQTSIRPTFRPSCRTSSSQERWPMTWQAPWHACSTPPARTPGCLSGKE